MTEERKQKQIAYDELMKLFDAETDDASKAVIADKMEKMQDTDDLDIFVVWKDCIELVHIYGQSDDQDSPTGFGFNIEDAVIQINRKVNFYDVGCMYGYVDAVSAAENELGVYGNGKPKMYVPTTWNDIEIVSSFIDTAWHPLRMVTKKEYDNYLQQIQNMKPYAGDYLSDVKWEEE